MRYIWLILFGFLLLFVTAFKLSFRLIRRVWDLLQDLVLSIFHSRSPKQAYHNFKSHKYAKARLSIPEEIIAMMAKVAASDGKISELEIEYMSDTIKTMTESMTKAGVNPKLIELTKKKLFSLANRAKKDDRPFSYYCHAISKAEPQVKMGAMLQLIAFAAVDGFSEDTQPFLYDIGAHLGFDKQQVDNLFEQVNGAKNAATFGQDPYEMLGVTEEMSLSEIRGIYRRLVKKYHPDYMHGQGMNDEEIQQATQKMQEINAAFAEIKRRKEAG